MTFKVCAVRQGGAASELASALNKRNDTSTCWDCDLWLFLHPGVVGMSFLNINKDIFFKAHSCSRFSSIISSNGENVQNRSKQPVKMNTLWYLRGPLRKGS